jgi:hypothetical protein
LTGRDGFAARHGIVGVFLLRTVHFGARDSATGFIRMCGGDGAATIAVATTGVLSALGATLFAATAEVALRCSRQHRHYKGVD